MIRHKSKAPCRLSLSGKSFTTMEMPNLRVETFLLTRHYRTRDLKTILKLKALNTKHHDKSHCNHGGHTIHNQSKMSSSLLTGV